VSAASTVKLGGSNRTKATTSLTNSGSSSSSRALAGKTTAGSSVAIQGTVTGSNGIGVRGLAHKGGSAVGVYGRSDSNAGVYGRGGFAGVSGRGSSYGGTFEGGPSGVYAQGTSQGVYGTGPIGIYGSGDIGVQGYGSQSGIRGESSFAGVVGLGGSYGVFGRASNTSGNNWGLRGVSDSPSGYGLLCEGNAAVTRTLTKAAGSFRIDHPLDPDNKWLSHSFVESPEMMNIYNGNVTTNGRGLATVTLPTWFPALNRSFRYQLTVIGTFAHAIIDREIEGRRFRIRTSEPHVKVSWQVTGVRRDAYAEAHRIKVQTRKTKAERGTRQFAPRGSGAQRMRYGPESLELRPSKREPKAVRPRIHLPDVSNDRR
jgi:hypothetical protein